MDKVMASKKSFKNSPALQFITPAEAAEPPETEAEKAPQTQKVPAAKKPSQAGKKAPPAAAKPEKVAQPQAVQNAATGQQGRPEAASAEKTAPASTEARAKMPPVAAGEAPSTGQPPMKLNPMYVETRSKRVQLLLQPSLQSKIREMAAAQGKSLNDLVHLVLERYADGTYPE